MEIIVNETPIELCEYIRRRVSAMTGVSEDRTEVRTINRIPPGASSMGKTIFQYRMLVKLVCEDGTMTEAWSEWIDCPGVSVGL